MISTVGKSCYEPTDRLTHTVSKAFHATESVARLGQGAFSIASQRRRRTDATRNIGLRLRQKQTIFFSIFSNTTLTLANTKPLPKWPNKLVTDAKPKHRLSPRGVTYRKPGWIGTEEVNRNTGLEQTGTQRQNIALLVGPSIGPSIGPSVGPSHC